MFRELQLLLDEDWLAMEAQTRTKSSPNGSPTFDEGPSIRDATSNAHDV